MRGVLVRCCSETRRAVAEVWTGAVRRMKGAARAAAVRIMVRDMRGVGNAAAWIVGKECKSVSQTLYIAI
ncbi:hypothetical protein CONPUDRAFT_159498 [Coniophora puteana RWD-64-598 SS2]|uniref:Uncharacterized protein n=1 Tax=Coniophora puteana (strain RWD-64-598) TaxID=741705 RepID=A0A5M3M8K9_CONPW|nr:uncharacterized protein CONPUDRAFT_159498 [Coniophora puteana RWD-64-598 SS2]EIW75377.1 hypothetical protein CONPUDRAFT_159498 [Coniophora puteana RWD-64-598 SS2]